MNSHPPLVTDKRSFFGMMEGREGRFELKDGSIMMMVGGTRLHALVTSDIENAFKSRVDRRAWWVSSADIAVEIGEDIRYPDVLVEEAVGDLKALSTAKPVVIVEVLSASSLAVDMHIKAAEYMSLASLEAYIVAAQDEPRLWIWHRSSEADRHWPKVPHEVHGREKAVPVAALGLDLPMAEIYASLPA